MSLRCRAGCWRPRERASLPLFQPFLDLPLFYRTLSLMPANSKNISLKVPSQGLFLSLVDIPLLPPPSSVGLKLEGGDYKAQVCYSIGPSLLRPLIEGVDWTALDPA